MMSLKGVTVACANSTSYIQTLAIRENELLDRALVTPKKMIWALQRQAARRYFHELLIRVPEFLIELGL